jgi:hypothetical protein
VLAHVGDGEEGELVLAVSRDEGATFGPAARLAPGAVRTWDGLHSGALDVGPDGRVHVAWISGAGPGVLCYASASPEGLPGPTLELGSPAGLGATTALALDAAGTVYLFYAASAPADDGALLDKSPAQPGLRVWMRRSLDGATFEAPVPIDKEKHDVSAESALAAHVDSGTGTLYVLYRCAARAKPTADALTRDMRLLSSEDAGASFATALVENWRQQRDPRTAASLVQDPSTTLAIWEARGTVLWTPIRRHEKKPQLPTEVKDAEVDLVRSCPAGASGDGEVILAWIERPHGEPTAPGRVAWRVWQRDQRIPIGEGVVSGSEGASAPVVIARAGGGFTILY